MEVDIYRSSQSSRRFLLVPHWGEKPSDLVANRPELNEFAGDLYKQTIELPDPRGPLIGLNAEEALSSINRDGFYVSQVEVRIEEVVRGPAED